MTQELIEKFGLVAEYDMDSFIGYRLGVDIYIKEDFTTGRITAIKGNRWVRFERNVMQWMDKETALKVIEGVFKDYA